MIGQVRIVNDNIFDNSDPQENRRLHRLANALHKKTRPDVISSQLLFAPGDRYSLQATEETERLLRSNRYIRDAEITPVQFADGIVDLEVRTKDVWTLSPSISFGRGGGKNSGGIGLKEYNLFGGGSQIGIGYKSDVDRDATSLRYANRNLFGTRIDLLTDYANNSDGFEQNFQLSQPFYALDTGRAWGTSLGTGRRIESLYDRGDVVARYEHTFDRHDAFYGWSSGLHGGWVRRYQAGVAYEDHSFDAVAADQLPLAQLPTDRRFVYPFAGIEILQNEYVESRNLDQMNRVEDRHLGARFSARLGYASRSFGSLDNAWILQSEFHNALLRNDRSTLLFDADLAGRVENGSARNAMITLASRYDLRQSDRRLLHARIRASFGSNLDVDNPLYLGGDNGLRGYPLRYQGGDKSVLMTIEQRVFTDWYPFRMFNIGGAVFADMGRTWGNDPAGAQQLGWLRDVGVGLRIGNSRSGIGRMIHIDIAFPLDGEQDISNVQLLVEAKRGF
jgi:hemolysin activation/secretion protein